MPADGKKVRERYQGEILQIATDEHHLTGQMDTELPCLAGVCIDSETHSQYRSIYGPTNVDNG
ncbi:hypothetical protein E4U55_001018 [Claviceps digitariae]|nr:hypothetical protein E4U55_001018 [Claviceps digitariae]